MYMFDDCVGFTLIPNPSNEDRYYVTLTVDGVVGGELSVVQVARTLTSVHHSRIRPMMRAVRAELAPRDAYRWERHELQSWLESSSGHLWTTFPVSRLVAGQ